MSKQFKGVLQLAMLEELGIIRRGKIDKVAVAIAAQSVSGRAFDIVALITAASKIVAFARTTESIIEDEAERGIDIGLHAEQMEGLVKQRKIIEAVATQISVSHAGIVTDTMMERCLEYLYRAQINCLIDDAEGPSTCQCSIKCGTLPAKETFQEYMHSLNKFVKEVEDGVNEFTAASLKEVCGEVATDFTTAMSLGKFSSGNVAKTLVGMARAEMRTAMAQMTNIDWQNPNMDDALDLYATAMAASVVADAAEIWCKELELACRITKTIDPSKN